MGSKINLPCQPCAGDLMHKTATNDTNRCKRKNENAILFQIFKKLSNMLGFLHKIISFAVTKKVLCMTNRPSVGREMVFKSDAKEIVIQYSIPKLHKNDATQQVII